ncbi:MAG: hypothetical protein OER82_03260 [Nitrosopumilus sp.]|nr:hypothetical protein [Nitrosopumilus sp.]
MKEQRANTGEDLDIDMARKIQLTCDLYGLPDCQHTDTLIEEQIEYVKQITFHLWKQKISNWVYENWLPMLILGVAVLIGVVFYTVWRYI